MHKPPSFIALLKSNYGLVLVACNVLLIGLLVFQQNPFAIFKTGYVGAKQLLDQPTKKITGITMLHPQYEQGVESLEIIQNTEKNQWQLIEKGADAQVNREYQADQQRVDSLLSSIDNSRRYYGIDRTVGKDQEFEIEVAENDSSRLGSGLTLQVRYQNGNEETFYIGKVNNDETYVRVAGENKFYLVQENLFEKSGGRDITFFRSRDLIRSQSLIKSVQAEDLSGQGIVKWDAGTGQWRQIYPSLNGGSQLDQSKVQSFIGELAQLKVEAFFDGLPDGVERLEPMKMIIRYSESDNVADQKELKFTAVAQNRNSKVIYIELQQEGVKKGRTITLASIPADLITKFLDYKSFLTQSNPANPAIN